MKLLTLRTLFPALRRGELPPREPARLSEEGSPRHEDGDRAGEYANALADRAGDFPHAPLRWGNFR